MKSWTKEEERILNANKKMSSQELAALLGTKTTKQVYQKRKYESSTGGDSLNAVNVNSIFPKPSQFAGVEMEGQSDVRNVQPVFKSARKKQVSQHFLDWACMTRSEMEDMGEIYTKRLHDEYMRDMHDKREVKLIEKMKKTLSVQDYKTIQQVAGSWK